MSVAATFSEQELREAGRSGASRRFVVTASGPLAPGLRIVLPDLRRAWRVMERGERLRAAGRAGSFESAKRPHRADTSVQAEF